MLLAAFFLTGAASLVLEVAWTRLLVLSLGTTPVAVGAVLAAFMGGMAIGSALAGQRPLNRLDPILAYALLEGWVGVYALASPLLLRSLGLVEANAQLALAIFLLLPATVAMGASLPILVRAFGPHEPAAAVGDLYAANTAGAVVGPLATAFYLFPSLGLHRTLLFAAGCALLVGAVLMSTRRFLAPPAAAARERQPRRARAGGLVLAAMAISGATAMVYEVAWSRTLSTAYGSSVYGVSITLSTFLLGIAGGSALASLLLRRWARPMPDIALAWLLIGSGSTAAATLLLAPRLPFVFLALYRTSPSHDLTIFVTQFVMAGLLMLPSTLCLGAMLPVATSACSGDPEGTVPKLYAANLAGSAVGALLGSAILLASVGIEVTVQTACVAAMGVAALIALRSSTLPRLTIGVATTVIVTALALEPAAARVARNLGLYSAPDSYVEYDARGFDHLMAAHQLLYYRDGRTATVAVQQVDRYRLLKINGKTDASNGRGDVETQILLGHLPLMASDAKRVAVIGWGSGMTVGAVLSHPVERVDAFEIEPAVVEASRFFEPDNGQPLDDARLRLTVGDARGELSRRAETYDLIISEPSNPWITGVSNLFTREFFELAAERLRPGGILCQWFHLYGMSEESTRSMLATFRDVFPHALVFKDRDLILLGSRRPIEFSWPRLRSLFSQPEIKASLAKAAVSYPADLLVKLRLDGPGVRAFTRGAPLNTDDNMRLELVAPRSLYRDRIEAIRTAMARHPPAPLDYLIDHGSEAHAEIELAASYFTAGQLDAALRHCRRALILESSFQGYKLLGQILHAAQEPQGARAAWERAVAMGGDAQDRRFVEALLRSLDQRTGP